MSLCNECDDTFYNPSNNYYEVYETEYKKNVCFTCSGDCSVQFEKKIKKVGEHWAPKNDSYFIHRLTLLNSRISRLQDEISFYNTARMEFVSNRMLSMEQAILKMNKQIQQHEFEIDVGKVEDIEKKVYNITTERQYDLREMEKLSDDLDKVKSKIDKTENAIEDIREDVYQMKESDEHAAKRMKH